MSSSYSTVLQENEYFRWSNKDKNRHFLDYFFFSVSVFFLQYSIFLDKSIFYRLNIGERNTGCLYFYFISVWKKNVVNTYI